MSRLNDVLGEPGFGVSHWMPRFYFSHYHIMSAAFFARESGKLERENKDKESFSSKRQSKHRAFVTGCIFSSVSFLEAQINELFTDSAEDQREHIHQLGDKIYLFAEMWKLGVPRTASYSILEKYEFALALAEREPFDRGSLVYQDTKLLISMRNALIHYEPLSSTSTHESSQKWEDKFRGKFSMNPLTGSKTPFFPIRCMGYGCARWAVESSVSFVDHFCVRLGIEPVFNSVRDSLSIEPSD
jgi:hypothetical protein